MIELKVIRVNPTTGEQDYDYELFQSLKQAKMLADLNPDITVDFDSMIDWNHTEDKYEY